MAGGPGGTGHGVESKSKAVAILMALFAAFGGILFGYDTGTISGIKVMPNFLQTFGTCPTSGAACYLKTNDESLVVSILSAGTFFGALLAFPMGDVVGRKFGIIASCLVFCLGVGLQLDTHWATFIIGRVIAGLGVGLISCLVPMYQSETSPKAVRGFVVGAYQWAITIGLLLAAIVNNSTKGRNNSTAWRTPISVQFAWAVILVAGMLYLPESPRFLVSKNKITAARKAMGRLASCHADDPLVETEIATILTALEAERAIGATSYIDCFRMGPGKNALRTLTGIFLQAWQQLTGINFIFYYGTTFFTRAGFSDPFIITIITNVVNVAMTIPGILMIDRAGRRPLLIWGAVVMCAMEFLVAIVGVTKGGVSADGTVEDPAAQKSLIAFVCIYIAAFAATWGPIAWVVTGEIFPLQIRAKAMSMSTASNWLWNFAIGYATPYLVNPTTTDPDGKVIHAANLGVKVFFIWGATCLGCIIFAYLCVPETKGLSLEQVDLLYRNSSILNSNSYRRQMIADGDTFLTRAVTSEKGEGSLSKHISHQDLDMEKVDRTATAGY